MQRNVQPYAAGTIYEIWKYNMITGANIVLSFMECLVQVGNGIERDTIGRQLEPYQWLPYGVA